MVLEKIPTFTEVQEWVNTSADVPNADHADTAGDADTVDGYNAIDFSARDYSSLPTAALLEGCTFSVDYGIPEVSVASGMVRVTDTNVQGANRSWSDGAFVYEIDAQTVSLTDSAVNHVYVEADRTSNGTASIVVNTTGTQPSTASLKIGEVDTANDRKSEQWSLLAPDGTLTFPSKSAADTALDDLRDGTTVYNRGQGAFLPDITEDTRNAVNQLFIDNARQDFELGLNLLDMDDGQFEVYANDNRIADQSNVDLNLGSPLNGKGTVSLASNETSGFTEHDKEDYGFLPDSVWITDDIDTNPANGTIEYEIEGENGNVVTVTQSETESSVDVSGTIETYGVTTRAVLKRDTDSDTSPVLDAYSAYISGQTPDDYLEANVTGVTEA